MSVINKGGDIVNIEVFTGETLNVTFDLGFNTVSPSLTHDFKVFDLQGKTNAVADYSSSVTSAGESVNVKTVVSIPAKEYWYYYEYTQGIEVTTARSGIFKVKAK
jgi:hypothetical protein